MPVIPLLRITLVTLCLALPAAAEDVTVFGAASLGDALGDMADAWEAETGLEATLVLAGSATLARQIDMGAPADVFISANTDWMDWLSARGRVLQNTRVDLASNALVLIASDPARASDAAVTEAVDISALLEPDGRLAIALPDAVPAGIYAKAALTALGQWDAVSSRLAPTDNVRAALALVALGEAPFGVVYATDAMAEPDVVVAGTFPDDLYPTIAYPAAVMAETSNRDSAEAFLTWLGSDTAATILADHGFLPPKAVQ